MKKFIFGSLFIFISLCVFAPKANAQYYNGIRSFNSVNLGINLNYSNTTASSYYQTPNYGNYYGGYNNSQNYYGGYGYMPTSYIIPYNYGSSFQYFYTPAPWGQNIQPWGQNMQPWGTNYYSW